MIIVDTSVWIDFFSATESLESLWLHRETRVQPIALTDLILCEVLQGIRNDRSFATTVTELQVFPVLDTGGEDMAIASAQNYRSLRARGHTVRKTIDCIIATYCIRYGHTLLHRDRDFDLFERHLGLRVVHPQTH